MFNFLCLCLFFSLPPKNHDKFVVAGVTIVNLTNLHKVAVSKDKELPVCTQYYLELTQVSYDSVNLESMF